MEILQRSSVQLSERLAYLGIMRTHSNPSKITALYMGGGTFRRRRFGAGHFGAISYFFFRVMKKKQ